MNGEFEQVRGRLAARISRWTGDGEVYVAPVPGLTLHRHTEPSAVIDCLLEPALSIPVQGRKRVRLGSDAFEYDRHRFLLTSLDLPVAMQFAEASPSAPFLCAVLRLDSRAISDLVLETGAQAPTKSGADKGPGAVLGETTVGLLSALERLIALLDEPNLLPTLAPLSQREIFYRVLRSDIGGHLWQMASVENRNLNIGRAIDRLKAGFREPLSIGELAAQVGMSSSRFHHHFRRLTSMSPLQFQKWLRLTEARRLMLVEGADASAAAYDVGYESPSQFSREYARQFGEPGSDGDIGRGDRMKQVLHPRIGRRQSPSEPDRAKHEDAVCKSDASEGDLSWTRERHVRVDHPGRRSGPSSNLPERS